MTWRRQLAYLTKRFPVKNAVIDCESSSPATRGRLWLNRWIVCAAETGSAEPRVVLRPARTVSQVARCQPSVPLRHIRAGAGKIDDIVIPLF